MALAVSVLMVLAGAIRAQTLTDLGATAPTPGARGHCPVEHQREHDISPDGLNYFTDNQTGHGAGEPGQTFTTGTNSSGYTLTSVSFMTAGLRCLRRHRHAPDLLPPHLFRVRRQRHPAANLHLGQFHLQRRRLAAMERVVHTGGCQYDLCLVIRQSEFDHQRLEALAVASGNPYAGGEIGLVPPGGGAITFGNSHGYDAVFDVGLIPHTCPPASTNSPCRRRTVCLSGRW